MNKIFILLISLMLFAACDRNEDPMPEPEPTPAPAPEPEPEPEPKVQRTVLIYMSGENNLTKDENYPGLSYLKDDLKEILEGSYKLNDNQHLICFIDSVDVDNKPHIIEVANGTSKEVYRFEEDFYASDPEKFRQVLQYTINKFPAEEYGLVLWGHSSGWIIHNDTVPSASTTPATTRGYGKDEGWDTNSSGRWMNINQMAQVLEAMPKLKFIFADCCNFMCVESAYELRNCADYLIGSPAEIPGDGAPYHLMVEKLFSNSSTFYSDICNCYYDYYLEAHSWPIYSQWELEGYSVPLSTLRLDQMENLANATKQIMKTCMPTYPQQLKLTGLPFYFFYDSDVFYDMKSVFKRYAPEESYNNWLEVFNTAVPYQAVSQKWESTLSGLVVQFPKFPEETDWWGAVSMFFPQTNYNNSYFSYNERIKRLQWYYAVDWASYGW